MKHLTKLCILLLTSSMVNLSANCDNLYVIAGVGGSFSQCADIKANPKVWDPAVQGYNAHLGKTELYTVGLGYSFCPLVRATVEGSFRPQFKYHKYQTGIDEGQFNFIGNKTRYFNLSSKSVLVNGYIYGEGISDCLRLNVGCNTFLQPYLGAGVGVSYNRISNFHTITTNKIEQNGITLFTADAAMNSITRRSFSWQATAGIELARCSLCSLDIGYRYFHGGKLKTNNWIVGGTNEATAPAWCGKIRANEIFVNFNIFKDF